jgi:hypothetical protein
MSRELAVSSRRLLSTHGSTRGSAYVMSNKIVRHADQLFVAWLDSPGMAMIRCLDLAANTLSPAVKLGQTAQPDNHCGPALTITSDNHLHCIVGSHHRPFRYRRTVRPLDISEWTDESFPPDSTYPSLVATADDTLHLTARAFVPRGESPKLIYQRRVPDGNWSEPLVLAQTPSPTGYTHYGNALVADARGVLHLVFHFFHGDPAESRYLAYMRSADGGTTWCRSDGSEIPLPATVDSVEIIADRPDLLVRGQSVCAAGDRLYAMGTGQGGAWTSLFALTPDDGWTETDLLPVIARFSPGCSSPQEGTVTVDAHGRLYVLLDVKSPDLPWGDASIEPLLLVSDDGGTTFEGMRLCAPDPSTPNWLSNLERSATTLPVAGPPAVLYTHGVKGVGCTPSDLTRVHLVTLG